MATQQSTATDPSVTQVSATAESSSRAQFTDRLLTVGDYKPTERLRRNATRFSDTTNPSTQALLRLGGRWLEAAGFLKGTKVRVQVMPGCLLIKPIPTVCERASRLPRKGTFHL